MKMERARINMEIVNKLDGKTYKITAISSITGTATAQEMILGDDGEWTGAFGDKEACVTEANSLAFRIVNDPEAYPVPMGYSVLDGKLLKDGRPACEAGELIFTGILAAQPDYLVLTAKKKGTKEGMAELMSYQVSRDRFNRLAAAPEGTRLIGYTDDSCGKAILAYSEVEEKEVEKDGEKKAVRVFSQAGVITIMNGKLKNSYRLDYPIVLDDAVVREIPDHDGEYEVFLPSDEEEDDDGILAMRKERRWDRANSYTLIDTFYTEPGADIQISWCYIYSTFVVKTEDMLMVLGNSLRVESPKVAELEGYDTLIDITKDGYEYRLTFSDEDYQFKTLVSKSTRDRGYIVTVE